MHMKPMIRMMKQIVASMMMARNRPMCVSHMPTPLGAVRAAGGATVASMSTGIPPYSVTRAKLGCGKSQVF